MKTGKSNNQRSNGDCHHPDTEVLTMRGWVKLKDVRHADKVAALFNEQNRKLVEGKGRRQLAPQMLVARFVHPEDVHTYPFEGTLYGLETNYAGYLVTPTHRVWRKGAGNAVHHWSVMDAKHLDEGVCAFMIRADFDLSDRSDPETFTIEPAISQNGGHVLPGPTEFPFKAWVKFMAFYLADGNIRHSKPASGEVVVTKAESAFCRIIESTLQEMGQEWTRTNIQYTTTSNRALRNYLEQFGKAPDKFVPDEIKHASKDTIELFLDTIWQCDGDKDIGKQYYTSSPRLAEDIQQLLILTGEAASITQRPPRWHQNYDMYTVHVLDYDSVGTKKNYKSAYYKEKYNGPVNCIQMPGEGIVITRFRGKVMWNGN